MPSAIRPIPHDKDLPKPTPPASDEFGTDMCVDFPVSERTETDPDFEVHDNSKLSQEQLHTLTCDLVLSKKKSEILASRLNKQGVLDPLANVSSFRNRGGKFKLFFLKVDNFVICSNLLGLISELNVPPAEQSPSHWRLFIDSGKDSLKAVLLHNGNVLPSIPIGYSRDKTESYQDLKDLLQHINYGKYCWKIVADFKVIGILLGLQPGNTKYPCFLCEWDSRAKQQHYTKKNWPERKKLIPGEKNIKYAPLVSPRNIILPPLHIKLGLFKNFIKALNDEKSYEHLAQCFPKLSNEKIRAGIFTGPQIRKVISDKNFEKTLNAKERDAWTALQTVINNFLGNHKAPSYKSDISKMLSTYRLMGCNMSLKIHYMHSHLNFFPENLGSLSDEHGERFHQDFSHYEKRFGCHQQINLVADFCWSIAQKNL